MSIYDTRKVELKTISTKDCYLFARLTSDTEVSKLVNLHIPVKDRASWYKSLFTQPENYYKSIVVNDEILGYIGIENRGKDTSEIIIMIGKRDYWGLGIGSKAIKDFLQTLYLEGKSTSIIYAKIFETNIRAIKCFLKAGFSIEGKKGYIMTLTLRSATDNL